MRAAWLRKQSGQAVVLVAVAVLALSAILALALDGGSIYLDKRQLQNAADSAALAGAEKLMSVPPSYTVMHDQAVGNLLQNLPGTSKAGTICSTNCPAQKTIGPPGGNGVGTLGLGAGYHIELSVTTSYTYQVTVWHSHAVVVAPIHGFQSTITLAARATAQNANLPYAVVLLQDKPAYSQFSNFNINGTPGGITLQYAGSNPNDRGGIFSNASIAPGNGIPSITFSLGGNEGDLWAVNESAGDRTALNVAGRVVGYQLETAGNLPFAATHIDFPNYPEPTPPAVTYNGSTVITGPPTVLCPGQYTNQITVQNGATALLYPGVYQVQANGVTVQGTLRTLLSTDLPVSCPGLPTLNVGASFDPGVIMEVRPDNMSGTTTCNKHIFSATATSTITLAPSPKYFNISLYIETMPNWQTTCTNAPLGTNVVRFAGGACYSIGGAIYGPADNMVLTGSGCGTGVGQIVAWTLLINGNGNVNETFDPTKLPYMKGLTQ
jgi:Flp pilus assembly protein TadG